LATGWVEKNEGLVVISSAARRQRLAIGRDGEAQDEEGCLTGILGLVPVVQHPQAKAPHHWPMATDQCGKGVLVMLLGKAAKQLPIRHAQRIGLWHEFSDVLQENGTPWPAHGPVSHGWISRGL
jgi:hypothetical protein